jgi:hypothetical protein
MREPSKALIDRLTLEVIETAGAKLDVNVVITLALKIGYRAGAYPEAAAPIPGPLASAMKTLKRSGLSVTQIASRFGVGRDDVLAAIKSKP